MTAFELKDRHRIEREFHDEWARDLDLAGIDPRRSFEAVTAVENQRVLALMGDPHGQRILDLGCGMGDAAVYFALRGASVCAVDVSPGMVDVCRRLAQREGVGSQVDAQVAVGEKLPFADGSFDVVYGNGVLHHLDLGVSGPEIARVLKPGGLGAFIEPLAYNPVIEIYRRLAAGVRTAAESPLTYRQFRAFFRHFASGELVEMQCFTQAIFLWFFFVEWANPSKVRYWKKITNEAERYGPAFRRLWAAERFAFKWFPPIRPLAWNVVVSVRKGQGTGAA
jgi:SAM-dependent methyltransferase